MTDALHASPLHSLLEPAAYPWHPASVEVVETHISWVFLAGEFVVKVKRPVDFGFVDHRALDRRRHSCEEEVRLNRRLTTGVYLDVVPIHQAASGVALEGGGPIIEWATLMRRLPAEGMLDRMIAEGAAEPSLGRRLAAVLVAFHQNATPCASDAESVTRLLAVVTENLDQLAPFAGSVLPPAEFARVEQALRRFSARDVGLFRQRVQAGCWRDGHGDLRCEHICLDRDVLQIFDCVEFNPAIRCADIASDLAFLTMDLQRLGQPALARELLATYAAHGMEIPDGLHRFYQAHRALVRAKSACLALQDDGSEHDRRLEADANAYLDLAARFISEVAPALVVMTGLSGTGKSTVAGRIGALLGARVAASDAVRKALSGVSGAAPSDWQEGIYTEEWSERTYERLLEIAGEEIAGGRPVVLDAAFLSSNRRRRAAALAAALGVPALLVETCCDDATALARIERRQQQGDVLSDADREIHHRQREAVRAHPPDVPDGVIAIPVDTDAPAVVWLDGLLAALDRARLIRAALGEPPGEPGQ